MKTKSSRYRMYGLLIGAALLADIFLVPLDMVIKLIIAIPGFAISWSLFNMGASIENGGVKYRNLLDVLKSRTVSFDEISRAIALPEIGEASKKYVPQHLALVLKNGKTINVASISNIGGKVDVTTWANEINSKLT